MKGFYELPYRKALNGADRNRHLLDLIEIGFTTPRGRCLNFRFQQVKELYTRLTKSRETALLVKSRLRYHNETPSMGGTLQA